MCEAQFSESNITHDSFYILSTHVSLQKIIKARFQIWVSIRKKKIVKNNMLLTLTQGPAFIYGRDNSMRKCEVHAFVRDNFVAFEVKSS